MVRVNSINFNVNFTGKTQQKEKQDPVINAALEELKKIKFDNNDVKYVKKLGAKPPFKNGHQAYNFIKDNNINVQFMKLPSDDIHAQWDVNNKTIKINEKYRDTKSKAVILAIAESTLHEAGHAKDMDGDSSIQEEINCLSLNSMSHRTLTAKDPGIFETDDANILKNGVNLYSAMYFNKDLSGLIEKVRKSYGSLPAGDRKHPPSNFANAIKSGAPNFTITA